VKPQKQAQIIRAKVDRLEAKYLRMWQLVFIVQLNKFAKRAAEMPFAAEAEIDIYFPGEIVERAYERMMREVYQEFKIDDVESFTKSITPDVWESLVLQRIGTIGAERITQINSFTKSYVLQRLRPILQDGTTRGLGIDEIARNIVKDIDEYKGNFARYRSERIARTEIISNANWASYTSVQNSGVADRLRKKWLPTIDGREREDHAAMINYPAIEMDEMFIVGGEEMYGPGDQSADPSQTINCRCVLVYERKDL